MGNLKTENTTYPNVIDTATVVANTTDEIVAEHINGPVTAILAIENELGTLLKGTEASLSARLARNIASNGGLLSGVAFPTSPPAITHFFFRSDGQTLYVYNTTTANYDEVTTASTLASYMRNNLATTVTVAHTFNPSSTGVPFILGANAQGQKVVGLNADTVDGLNPGSAAGIATLDANIRLVEPANTVYDGVGNRSASPTSGANKIPVGDASGKIAAGWGGSASTLATLNASSKVVEEPASKGQASGIASLNASSKVVEEPASKGQVSGVASLDSNTKVVEDPANATAIPTINKIPIADQTGGRLANGWMPALVDVNARPAFKAYVSTDAGFTGGSFVKLLADTEEFDTNNNYDNTTNFRFTPTVAGVYCFIVQFYGADNASGEWVNIMAALYKNGTIYDQHTDDKQISGGTLAGRGMFVTTAYANGSTDYFEAYFLMGTVGACHLISGVPRSNCFSAFRVA